MSSTGDTEIVRTEALIRLFKSDRFRPLGGVTAQASQALSSFGLQFVAARMLGVDGLGRFAVLFGFIVVMTAVTSGFVGDSLTVLERSDGAIRSALQCWLLVFAVATFSVMSAGAVLTGFLDVVDSLAFGVASTMFVVEDTIRRYLMAVIQFWRIVLVDLTALFAALAVVILGGSVDLGLLLWALAGGQAMAIIVGWRLIPTPERFFAKRKPAAMAAVARFGVWRALQQTVRAATLALVRIICLLVVSAAAVGELASARIYMAPTILVVGGVSSYLFASFAQSKNVPIDSLLRSADRVMRQMALATLAIGAAFVLAIPWLGPLLTGGEYEISLPIAAGWAAYATAIACVAPYGQLASVRGHERSVLAWRTADSALSLVATLVVVGILDTVSVVPLVLAVWPVLSGIAIRRVIQQGLQHTAHGMERNGSS